MLATLTAPPLAFGPRQAGRTTSDYERETVQLNWEGNQRIGEEQLRRKSCSSDSTASGRTTAFFGLANGANSEAETLRQGLQASMGPGNGPREPRRRVACRLFRPSLAFPNSLGIPRMAQWCELKGVRGTLILFVLLFVPLHAFVSYPATCCPPLGFQPTPS